VGPIGSSMAGLQSASKLAYKLRACCIDCNLTLLLMRQLITDKLRDARVMECKSDL